MKNVAKRFKRYRESKKMTHADLAKTLNYSGQSIIEAIESGELQLDERSFAPFKLLEDAYRAEPKFYPQSALEPWDDVYVSQVYEDLETGCEQIDDDEMLQEAIEAGHEIFWSVYLHLVEGGLTCVADVATKEQAEALDALLTNAVKSHT